MLERSSGPLRYVLGWVCALGSLGLGFGIQAVMDHGHLERGFWLSAARTLSGFVIVCALWTPTLVAFDLGSRALFGLSTRGRRFQVLAGVIAVAGLGGALWKSSVDGFFGSGRAAAFGGLVLVWIVAMLRHGHWRDRPIMRLGLRVVHLLPWLGSMLVILLWSGDPVLDYTASFAVWLLVIVASVALVDLGRIRPRAQLIATGTAALLLAAIVGVGQSTWIEPGLKPRATTNVLLVIVDTLRADRTDLARMPATGRDLTRSLRGALKGGSVFERAVSQSSWTMPATASILTGRYPAAHGATAVDGYLAAHNTTLAELLREAGYRTGAVVSHFFVNRVRGFAQGFDEFDDSHALGHGAITGQGVTDTALAMVDGDDRPFFLMAHYFDPHFDYRDHAEWTHADSYRGPLRGSQPEMHELMQMRDRLSDADLDYLRSLYDEEVAYTDRQTARLISGVLERYPDTMVVFTADHGEAFMEHGWLGHTTSLHDEIVRVPLAVRMPAARGPATLSATVETRAIFGAVLEHLGLAKWAGGTPSLLAQIRGEAGSAVALSDVSLPFVTDGRGEHRLRSARTDAWKLVVDNRKTAPVLYSLREDPLEQQNFAAEHPEQVNALQKVLAGQPLKGAEVPTTTVAPAVQRQLRALGYVAE